MVDKSVLLKTSAAPEKVLVNLAVVRHFTKCFKEHKFLLKEEEGSIINYYINSIKRRKDKNGTGPQASSTTSQVKTMKEMITESKNEIKEK